MRHTGITTTYCRYIMEPGKITLGDVASLAVRYVWQTAVSWIPFVPPDAGLVPAGAVKQVRFASRAPIEGVRVPKIQCPNPVDLDECANAAVAAVDSSVANTTDSDDRKAPLILSRCSRGGKTTMLTAIDSKLRNRGYATVLVSFNGGSFNQPQDELDSEALFRVITNQIDPSFGKDEKRKCDWPALDKYIGNSKPFVLLIDEINVLGQQIGSELAKVLVEFFIDRPGRQLIMSSHMPMLGASASGLWTESMVGKYSDRDIEIVRMPISYDIGELTRMDSTLCSGITPSIAAYYGGMPSLMYAVMRRQTKESPRNKFRNIMANIPPDPNAFLPFVTALLTGESHPAITNYLPFTSEMSSDKLVKWPLCYIHCIMNHFKKPTSGLIVECLDELQHSSNVVGDGMVWEASTRIAILLHAARAVDPQDGAAGPLNVCLPGEAVKAKIAKIPLGVGVKTPEEARTRMLAHAQEFSSPTLVLFVPSEAKFAQFDGFICLIKNKRIVRTSGFQCKDSSEGAVGAVPEWVSGGGHLLRADAPVSCKTLGRNANGWYYYNLTDTDNFLGWSLQIMRRPEQLAGAKADT